MRRVRYSVAVSLDGYIAGPEGEYDWIPEDPAIDFAAFFATVDTVLLGRKTYDVVGRGGGDAPEMVGSMDCYVFSTTLRQEDHPDVTIVADDAEGVVRELKERGNGSGVGDVGDGGSPESDDRPKDIWLMGGGVLAGHLFRAGLVDAVELGIVPRVIGGGIPLVPADIDVSLSLRKTETFPSGIVLAKYDVVNRTDE